MKRVLCVLAATLVSLLSLTAPANAAPPLYCTAGSHQTNGPATYHQLIGERHYAGDSPVTYRYWLRVNPTTAVPRFMGASYARCSAVSQPVEPMTPTSAVGQPPCTKAGDYEETVHGKKVAHRYIGSWGSHPGQVDFRFWLHEEETAGDSWEYRESSIVMCWFLSR